MKRAELLWAYLADDGEEEGLCAAITELGPAPYIGAHIESAKNLRERVQQLADESGKTIRLVVFRGREDLETFLPVKSRKT